MDYCGSELEGIIQYHCQGVMMVDGELPGHVPSLSGNRKDNECGSSACILLFIQSRTSSHGIPLPAFRECLPFIAKSS